MLDPSNQITLNLRFPGSFDGGSNNLWGDDEFGDLPPPAMSSSISDFVWWCISNTTIAGAAANWIIHTAIPGDYTETVIQQDVDARISDVVLGGGKRPSRCEMLELMIKEGVYTRAQAKST